MAEDLLYQTEQAILSLQRDPEDFKGQALIQLRDLVERRNMLIEESASVVSPSIVVVLTLWLGVIFASFGYSAPRNAVMVIILLVCAPSVASAIFLVLEIDRPKSGLTTVSSAPMRHALAHREEAHQINVK